MNFVLVIVSLATLVGATATTPDSEYRAAFAVVAAAFQEFETRLKSDEQSKSDLPMLPCASNPKWQTSAPCEHIALCVDEMRTIVTATIGVKTARRSGTTGGWFEAGALFRGHALEFSKLPMPSGTVAVDMDRLPAVREQFTALFQAWGLSTLSPFGEAEWRIGGEDEVALLSHAIFLADSAILRIEGVDADAQLTQWDAFKTEAFEALGLAVPKTVPGGSGGIRPPREQDAETTEVPDEEFEAVGRMDASPTYILF